MPSLIPLIPAAIGAAASIGGAALASGSKKTTTQPLLTDPLQTAQTAGLNDVEGILKNPSAGLAPILSGAQDSINTSYKNLPNIATSMLASRGFGSSGAVGTSTYDTEGARLGSLSSLYAQIAQLSSNRQLSADQILNSMVATGKGETTTTPNNSGAAALLSGGSALSNISTLATLAKMLNTGGGSPAATPGSGGIIGTGASPVGTPATIDTGGVNSNPGIFDGFSPDPSGSGWS